jgi:hypothetical protein
VSAVVLGVDPGAKGTGLALVAHGQLRHAETVRTVRADPLRPAHTYLASVLEQVTLALIDAGQRGELVEAIAVEGVTKPNPHMNRRNGRAATDPSHIMGAAMVFGAVVAHDWPVRVLVVRPGGNGSRPLGAYPSPLVSDAERRVSGWQMRPAGTGKLKDQRSAYDVAREAAQYVPAIAGTTRLTYLY